MIGEVLPAVTIFKPFSELLGGLYQISLFEQGSIELPAEWSATFPSGAAIIDFVIERYPYLDLPPDKRLLKRREEEYLIFRAVEDLHALPLIQKGFDNVVDFIAIANSISNRRKSRAGRSLELHLERIFQEEGLTGFDTQATTEGNKKPDFLFPDIESYRDPNFSDGRLNMLAVKTTLKDRWRQVLNEAHRIPHKYLFTLQEGVSENQFKEMTSEGVTLVVPKALIKKYPQTTRSALISLEDFIALIEKAGKTS
jgi:type II restriction enzyme